MKYSKILNYVRSWGAEINTRIQRLYVDGVTSYNTLQETYVKVGYKNPISGFARQDNNCIYLMDAVIQSHSVSDLRYTKYDKKLIYVYKQFAILTHEVFHIQQDLNVEKYVADPDYKRFIEDTNDAKALAFLMIHLGELSEVISKEIGRDCYMDLYHLIMSDLARYNGAELKYQTRKVG